MAIVNALRFTARSGGIISDEECWHLRLRKTHHTRHIHELVPPALVGRTEVAAVYGGVGSPPFHAEVVHRAHGELEARAGEGALPQTLEGMGEIVLAAFNETSRRYVDDRLRFLYGFGLDGLNSDRIPGDGEELPIGQDVVRKRALKIARLEEEFEDASLAPPNHVCLSGWDPSGGFHGFTIKQEDGVLSLQGSGFESLGSGRYAGGIHFQKLLGRMTLGERRDGPGTAVGLGFLVSSIIEAAEHFGQVGGDCEMILIDGEAKPASRVRRFGGERVRLALEIEKAARWEFVPREKAQKLLGRLLLDEAKVAEVESALFRAAAAPRALDLALRGYRIGPGSGTFRKNTFDAR
jgi:hypothetical protein